jgi:hypothetical protein
MTPQSPSVPSAGEQRPRPYDQDRYDELVQRLGRILLEIAPAGWRRIELRITMTATVSDVALAVLMGDGGSAEVEPPRDFAEIAAELRSMMYRTDEGTWFGMRFMMDPPTAYWVSFNGEFDPLWDPPLLPEEWERDLATFPRADEHVPGWLRDRLQRPANAPGNG